MLGGIDRDKLYRTPARFQEHGWAQAGHTDGVTTYQDSASLWDGEQAPTHFLVPDLLQLTSSNEPDWRNAL